MEITEQQERVVSEILEDLRSSEERRGRPALYVKLIKDWWCWKIVMNRQAVILPSLLLKLQEEKLRYEIRIGVKSKYLLIKQPLKYKSAK